MDVIFDIDGTIADLSHRRHYITTKPKNYDAFYSAMVHDVPILPVINCMKALDRAHCRIILCSGRPDNYREQTEKWCTQHGIRWDALYMRKAGDFRADDIIKEELLDQLTNDGFEPTLVFDDRKRVVDMWRKNGIICAQVDEGNF